VEKSARVFRRILTDLLREPHDAMRHEMDDAELEKLRQSLREMGVLQPLCVVPVKDGVRVVLNPATEKAFRQHEAEGGLYEVRAGHRRLIAARGILLESCPCVVFLDVELADRAIMFHENQFREDPTDYDKAVMFAEQANVPGVTEAELCRMFGHGISYIYDRMKILSWPEEIRAALHTRQINFGIGRLLAAVKDESYQRYFLNLAVMQGATYHLVQSWIKEFEGRRDAMTPLPPRPGPQPVAVTNPAAPLACIVCGPKASYELRNVFICHDCHAQIEAAQDAVKETTPPTPETVQ
jgi:ParB family chromosome partitioning protein